MCVSKTKSHISNNHVEKNIFRILLSLCSPFCWSQRCSHKINQYSSLSWSLTSTPMFLFSWNILDSKPLKIASSNCSELRIEQKRRVLTWTVYKSFQLADRLYIWYIYMFPGSNGDIHRIYSLDHWNYS